MTVSRVLKVLGVFLALALAAPAVALAGQNPPPIAEEDDPDRDPNRNQPDFVIVNLPTTLRVPKFKSAFRVTHRFGRPLGAGTFGDLAGDLFGLDSGALIGLEYRFGLARGLQVGIVRTSDKTIEFFGQYTVVQQSGTRPVGVGLLASIDGTDNFSDEHSPTLGLIVSRELGGAGAVYVEPTWVHNANIFPPGIFADTDNDTFLLGLGARIRVRPTLYLVGEFIPRAGFTPGATFGSFGLEKRAGGHVFQINFSNGTRTTMGQLAQGGTAGDDWYLGFNISRKFF